MERKTMKLADLKHHPLLAHSPMLAAEHPDAAAIRASLAANGFTQAVVVNEAGEIMDGRHRVREALALGLTECPVEVRPDAEAREVILNSLIARRHLAKWQMVYSVATLIDLEAKAGIKARTGNLKRGTAHPSSPETQEVRFGETLGFLGISKETWWSVRRVLEKFESRPDWRERYEPRMFLPDSHPDYLNLAAVARAVGAEGAYETHAPDLRKARAAHELFIARAFEGAQKHFEFWEELGESQRQAATGAAVSAVLAWPRDVQVAVAKELSAAARGRR